MTAEDALEAADAIIEPHWLAYTLTAEIFWEAVNTSGMTDFWDQDDLEGWVAGCLETYRESKQQHDQRCRDLIAGCSIILANRGICRPLGLSSPCGVG